MGIIAFVHANDWSLIPFVLICVAVVIAFIGSAGFARTAKRDSVRVMVVLSIAIAFYCLFIVGFVGSGLIQTAFIPFGPLFLVTTIGIAISMGFTRLGSQIVNEIPIAWLVGFQGFRLPLEIVLHDWKSTGTIPETMTWTGSNWDILSGTFAMIACAFVSNRRWLAWTVNIVGILLLVNVGRVAILSSPVPFGWQVDPPLELILYLPYAFIVPLCVGGAALGHVLLTRRLLSSKQGVGDLNEAL